MAPKETIPQGDALAEPYLCAMAACASDAPPLLHVPIQKVEQKEDQLFEMADVV